MSLISSIFLLQISHMFRFIVAITPLLIQTLYYLLFAVTGCPIKSKLRIYLAGGLREVHHGRGVIVDGSMTTGSRGWGSSPMEQEAGSSYKYQGPLRSPTSFIKVQPKGSPTFVPLNVVLWYNIYILLSLYSICIYACRSDRLKLDNQLVVLPSGRLFLSLPSLVTYSEGLTPCGLYPHLLWYVSCYFCSAHV